MLQSAVLDITKAKQGTFAGKQVCRQPTHITKLLFFLGSINSARYTLSSKLSRVMRSCTFMYNFAKANRTLPFSASNSAMGIYLILRNPSLNVRVVGLYIQLSVYAPVL